MPIQIRQSAPQPIQDILPIPPSFPNLPDDVMQRYPSLRGWDTDTRAWYRKLSSALIDSNRTVATTTVAAKKANDVLGVEIVQLSEEFQDAAGNLSGKYTLQVIAGNVVTGMIITSSTGPGTPVSDVTFQASSFKIYNSVTGVAMFDVSGTDVKLAGTLVVSTNGKVYIGTGTYGNSNTAFYVDSAGQFSLKDKLTWNGTTLTITGVINVTSISGLNYAGAASPGGAANSITGQGSLATQSSVDYNSEVTNRPVDSVGRIIVSPTPSGSGLFLGSTNLGYYAAGAWKTYMDSSGNFYLSGSGSNGLSWNGSALTINGTITSTSGTIGGFTIGATTLSAGSGSTYIEMSSGSPPRILMGTNTGTVANNVISAGGLSSGEGSTTLAQIGSFGVAGSRAGGVRIFNNSGSLTVDIAGSTGVVSATSFSGSGASLTGITSGQVSGLAASATTDTTNASNISSGTLSNSRLPSAISVTSLATANFEASVGTAVDVKDVNLRVYSGATQNARIDYTTGYYYVRGNQVVGARGTRGLATIVEVVALLDAWGAWA